MLRSDSASPCVGFAEQGAQLRRVAKGRGFRAKAGELQFLRWKYHHEYFSLGGVTPTLRAAYPVYAMLRSLVFTPLHRLRYVLGRWNKTEKEVFRQEMEKHRRLNDFFGKST